MNGKLPVVAAGLALLASGVVSEAQEFTKRAGLGGFFDYSRPIMSVQKRFAQAAKVGGTFSYASSARAELEVEYHHSRFGTGKLEKKTFKWQVDGNFYSSPGAKSDLTFDSVMFNALVRKRSRNAFVSGKATPYLAFGTGFHHYVSNVSGLVYPGQSKAPLDTKITFTPAKDRRTALAVSVGVGLEMFATEGFAVDLRGRYNFVLGELRPFEDWQIPKAPSMNLIDVGVGMKFFFKAK